MRTAIAIASSMLLAVPASAQFTNCMANGPFVNCNSTDGAMTTCNRTGTIVNCNTIGGQSAEQPAAGVAGPAIGEIVSMFHDAHVRHVRALIGKSLQAGDCPTALHDALGSGDMDLATKVKAYCDATGRAAPVSSAPLPATASNMLSPYEAGRQAALAAAGGQRP